MEAVTVDNVPSVVRIFCNSKLGVRGGKPFMDSKDPAAVVGNVAGAYLDARCLHVVANLGVADIIGDTPRAMDDIASALSADVTALARIIRRLAALGIFTMKGDQVAHNEASRLLKSDNPHGVLPLVRLQGLPLLWDSFRELEFAVKTGRPATESIYPEGFFAYLASHPEESRQYDDGMATMTGQRVADMVPAYDFSPFQVIADIGGGRGQLLKAVIEQTPSATGILVDRPHVLDGLHAGERITLQQGDFFTDPLPLADCYLLSNIIHDWGDSEATAILRSVRAAAQATSTLLLFEYVVPDDVEPFYASDIDVFMLALVSGRERTATEYVQLLDASDFTFVRSIETLGQTIIEARPR